MKAPTWVRRLSNQRKIDAIAAVSRPGLASLVYRQVPNASEDCVLIRLLCAVPVVGVIPHPQNADVFAPTNTPRLSENEQSQSVTLLGLTCAVPFEYIHRDTA